MNGKSAKKGLVPALFAAVTAAILVAAVVSICVGKYSITVDDIRAIFAGKEVDDMTRRVFLTLRLSRTIMAIIAGVGLGVAGSVYQIIFKNPLASPDIIGIAGGANLGAAIAIVSNIRHVRNCKRSFLGRLGSGSMRYAAR